MDRSLNGAVIHEHNDRRHEINEWRQVFRACLKTKQRRTHQPNARKHNRVRRLLHVLLIPFKFNQ